MFLIFSSSEPYKLLYASSEARRTIADLEPQKTEIGSFFEIQSIGEWSESVQKLLSGDCESVEKLFNISSLRGSGSYVAVLSLGILNGTQVIELRATRSFLPKSGPGIDFTQSQKIADAEYRLDISEQKLASIIELAVDGIVIINELGIIQGFNRAAEAMFNYRVEEVVGRNVAILMPHPHSELHDNYIRRYLNTGIPHIVGIGRQVEARRKDGSLFPIDLAVGEVKLEKGSLFTGFIRDLSESRKLESERKSFFEMSLDLFCILEQDGSFRRTNPQWLELLGYTPEDLAGCKLIDLVEEDNTGEKKQLIADVLACRNIYGRVMRLRQRNGEYRWILWNSTPDNANAVIYGVARDITEQRQILEELQAAKQEAERSSHAKSFFIAKMSHELKTPLNSIMGFSRHLMKNRAGNFAQKDLLYLERIYQNGVALLRLINSVLDFARLEAGITQVDVQSVSVQALLQEVLDLMDIQIEENSNPVQLILPESCNNVETDPVKLRQILQNLIDNAIKFSDGKSVIVELTVSETDDPLQVDVIDSGPGISKEQMELIFNEFQQGDNSIAIRYGGAGLGLAIASSFCDLLGLKIDVYSELHKGSRFSIVFTRKGEGHD